jgi:hypothetical protein
MTLQPTVFSNHYYRELLAGGGAFLSDKSLLADPVTAQWVRRVARSFRVPLIMATPGNTRDREKTLELGPATYYCEARAGGP